MGRWGEVKRQFKILFFLILVQNLSAFHLKNIFPNIWINPTWKNFISNPPSKWLILFYTILILFICLSILFVIDICYHTLLSFSLVSTSLLKSLSREWPFPTLLVFFYSSICLSSSSSLECVLWFSSSLFSPSPFFSPLVNFRHKLWETITKS